MAQMKLSTKQKQTCRHRKQAFSCQAGAEKMRDGLDIWS